MKSSTKAACGPCGFCDRLSLLLREAKELFEFASFGNSLTNLHNKGKKCFYFSISLPWNFLWSYSANIDFFFFFFFPVSKSPWFGFLNTQSQLPVVTLGFWHLSNWIVSLVSLLLSSFLIPPLFSLHFLSPPDQLYIVCFCSTDALTTLSLSFF